MVSIHGSWETTPPPKMAWCSEKLIPEKSCYSKRKSERTILRMVEDQLIFLKYGLCLSKRNGNTHASIHVHKCL